MSLFSAKMSIYSFDVFFSYLHNFEPTKNIKKNVR